MTDSTGTGSDKPLELAAALVLPENRVTVSAYLVAEGGLVIAASLLAESYPPQPGGTTVPVHGLDEATLDWESAGPIRWTPARVVLSGVIHAGALTLGGAQGA